MSQEITTKAVRGRPKGSTIDPLLIQKRLSITLDKYHQQVAKSAGDGNLSFGLRLALDFWSKNKQ